MNKVLKISFILFLFTINLSIVYGQSVSIACPKSVKAGSKFSCTINANSNEEYGGVDAKLTYSDGLTYNGFTKSFSNGEIYNNKLSVYDVDLKKGTSKVGTISFTLNKSAKGNQTITLTNVIMYDAESLGHEINNASSVVKIDTSTNKSTSASSGTSGNASSGNGSGNTTDSSKIKNLTIKNQNIEFNQNINEYKLVVENSVTKLDIDIDLESTRSKYDIKGNENFKVGDNLVEIIVTSTKGDVTIYKITVTRLAQSSNSLLKSLEIKNYHLKFEEQKFKYYIILNNKTDSLEIEAISQDNKSLVVIGGNKNLKTGKTINIIVQAEDGTNSMYILQIIKKSSLIYLGIISTIFIGITVSIIIICYRKKRKNNQIFTDLHQ